MTCYYEVYSGLNVVKIVLRGEFRPRHVLNLLDALDRDPAYHNRIDELIYFDGFVLNDSETGNLTNLLNLMRGVFLMNNHAKSLALVADSESAKRFAAACAGIIGRNPALTVGVFDTAGAALAFLGQSAPCLKPSAKATG